MVGSVVQWCHASNPHSNGFTHTKSHQKRSSGQSDVLPCQHPQYCRFLIMNNRPPKWKISSHKIEHQATGWKALPISLSFAHLSFLISRDLQVCVSQELLPAQIAITLGIKGTLLKVPCAPHKDPFKTVLPSSTFHWLYNEGQVLWAMVFHHFWFADQYIRFDEHAGQYGANPRWLIDRRLAFLTTC